MKMFALILTVTFLLLACSKHHDHPGNTTPKPPADLDKPYTLPGASQANAAYDASNYGIYKGIAIAATESTKTFGFNIANNGKTVYCLEYERGLLRDSLIRYRIDSVIYQFHQPWEIDSSVITPGKDLYAGFYSYIPDSADAMVTLRANGDGSSPNLFVHTQNSYLAAGLKEKSNNQVYCFVGTWQGSHVTASNVTDSGKIAFVLNGDSVLALQIDISDYQYFEPGAAAAIVNGHFVIESFDGPPPGGYNFFLTGTISGDTVSGTWTRTYTTATGTFRAQRTL